MSLCREPRRQVLLRQMALEHTDQTADRSVNNVISMFSLHNQAEKSCFYSINLIAIQVTVNKDHLSIFSCQV